MQDQKQPIDETETELCTNCGKWEVLVEETGWCRKCSGMAPLVSCSRCGKPCEKSNRRLCYSCKYIIWLENNADQIELVMVELGLSAAKAKEIVRIKNRPNCLCCGEPIKGGQNGKNYFCRRTRACKTGQNSYHYYKTKCDGLALEKAFLAAQRERLIEIAAQKQQIRTKDKAA